MQPYLRNRNSDTSAFASPGLSLTEAHMLKDHHSSKLNKQ